MINMSEVVKLEIIKSTQDLLSKYIKKPPLTEKLLRKPPFRYLHDITTAVMRETGYLQGLYSPDELNPENIKDRESKIAFLEKLIAAVNLSTGINITARPNKIVAGLDVAKTNELLQVIAKALDKKIDSSKAVEQVLNKNDQGGHQKKSLRKVSEKESLKGKMSKDTKTSESKTREPRTSDILKKKTKERAKVMEKTEYKKAKPKKDVSPVKMNSEIPIGVKSLREDRKNDGKPDDSSIKIDENNVPAKSIDNENQQSPDIKYGVKSSPGKPPVQQESLLVDEEKKEHVKSKKIELKEPKLPFEEFREAKLDNENRDNSRTEDELKRPQSARAIHRKKPARMPSGEIDEKGASKNELNEGSITSNELSVSDTNKITDKIPVQRPKTAARPASARPGAPRLRDRATIHLHDTDNKVTTEPVNLIVDSKPLPADDDALVILEPPSSQTAMYLALDDNSSETINQGHLVAQILETQKELEDLTLTATAPGTAQKVDISWGTDRLEAVAREVEKLRYGIQTATRAANPLGKLIDYLQEDIDSMQTELETWISTNQQLSKQLLEEQRLTEESTKPLAAQLQDIDQLIEEQMEEMNIVKAAIMRNDERLEKLLKTTNNPD